MLNTITRLKYIHKTTLRSEVYLSLKQAILKGEAAQGEKLTIARLSQLTGFSPTPIREALLKLEQEGLVNRLPNGNFIVHQFSSSIVV